MRNIGIIGGTGIYDSGKILGLKEKLIYTPYGKVKLNLGSIAGNRVAFMNRHGIDHGTPPHKVNYKANIFALKLVGCEEIFATTAVGSLNPNMKPGEFVVCSNIIDFTQNRDNTFFDGMLRGVAHVDFTYPYCETCRQRAIRNLEKLGLPFHREGVYVCTEGPRFETAAEVKLFASWGGDVVGMTNMPESVLAREAEMCYTTVSIVTNMGAGISPKPLSHKEVVAAMVDSVNNMNRLISCYIADNDPIEEQCHCRNCMAEFGGFKMKLDQEE